jgi:hypothetical protein
MKTPVKRRFLLRIISGVLLVLLFAGALVSALLKTETRRVFLFYKSDLSIEAEERSLYHFSEREADLRHYIDEVLLGPLSPGLERLFPLGTGLRSLLYREGRLYADFSIEALENSGSAPPRLRWDLLAEGIKRNFTWIRKTDFFIEGEKVAFSSLY